LSFWFYHPIMGGLYPFDVSVRIQFLGRRTLSGEISLLAGG
jgi:hypothetical protein